MSLYRNKIRRKVLVKGVVHKLKRIINLVKSPAKEIKLLDEKIWDEIKEGLDYGGLEVKYYKFSNVYFPSIENEILNYFEVKEVDDDTIENVYDYISDYILAKTSKYKDLNWIEGEDESGKYFQVELNDLY